MVRRLKAGLVWDIAVWSSDVIHQSPLVSRTSQDRDVH
ncbi:hypothetical protein BSF40_04810 [Pseudomonas sp. ACN5]|nr:hypothetical protein BSF40_04810 [Pseudomonas sp. ACN5]